MRRSLLLALAATAFAVGAPPAAAAEFLVDTTTDPADPSTFACDVATDDDCPLRAAVKLANDLPGPDQITFEAALPPIEIDTGVTLAVTDQVVISDPEGDVEVRWSSPTATGPMILLAAADPLLPTVGAAGSEIERIRLSGAGPVTPAPLPAALMRVEAGSTTSATILDRVTFSDADGNALEVGGAQAQRLNVVTPTVTSPGLSGIMVDGSARDVSVSGGTVQDAGIDGVAVGGSAQRVTIAGTTIQSNVGDGLDVSGAAAGVVLTGALVTGNQGAGARVNGAQRVQITRTRLHGNVGLPIDLLNGGNGAIATPSGVRVGPRQADGTLPLSGTTGSAGTVELFSGNPFGVGPTSFLEAFAVGGGFFSRVISPEPKPGDTFALTHTEGDGDTSEFSAPAVVPDDVFSPFLLGGVAVSANEVRIQPSEPLDGASLQPSDFVLEMAGSTRAITKVTAAPDGSSVTLTSSGWRAGEAGFVGLAAPGAVTDGAGNASLALARVRVAAAPGDFISPVISSLSIRPTTICLTRGPRCRRPGAYVSFVTSETGRARWEVLRGNRAIGGRNFATDPGRNRVRFDGKVRGRKLRAGRYRMLVYSRDEVGNETVEPAIRLFRVKRVTAKRKR